MSEKVIVYGTLKKGHGNHDVMKSAGGTHLGDALIEEATMFSLGGFPAISFDEGDGVYGEVYEVENLGPVDKLEGYPIMYDRKQVDTPYGLAWAYHMHPMKTLRLPVVEEGVW